MIARAAAFPENQGLDALTDCRLYNLHKHSNSPWWKMVKCNIKQLKKEQLTKLQPLRLTPAYYRTLSWCRVWATDSLLLRNMTRCWKNVLQYIKSFIKINILFATIFLFFKPLFGAISVSLSSFVNFVQLIYLSLCGYCQKTYLTPYNKSISINKQNLGSDQYRHIKHTHTHTHTHTYTLHTLLCSCMDTVLCLWTELTWKADVIISQRETSDWPKTDPYTHCAVLISQHTVPHQCVSCVGMHVCKRVVD